MRSALKICLGILATTATLTTTSVFAAAQPPEVDSKGLHLVVDSEMRLVYKLPAADISSYNKVILVDAFVSFREGWQDDHDTGMNRITEQDIEEIKQKLAAEFRKVFTQTLEEKGYPVVEESAAGTGVLIVRPAIINLDVTAPLPNQQSGRQRTAAGSAGEMTLYAELYDSADNQLLARVIDPQADRGFGGQMMLQSSGTNRIAVDRIIRHWAEALADNLDQSIRD